ncbi:HEAT repeat domain-containing protein [Thermomonospora umbrina]|uniref:HEAT repeat protein n=1 Tax=Thermomonospora umbrina TaxID=111806 RepID=A0A3D9SQ62_9ACTN|nr:HEAT repeat domain-containing protein [Thermomonospora umbrina]REE97757.1 HEAT repeat protein [Thermomonospora umbrina]
MACVEDDDPRSLRRLGLLALAERLDAGHVVDGAEPLPQAVDEVPEVALAQARLYRRLRHGPCPQWRAVELPVRVRIAWLSAEIAHRPEVARDEPPGEPLYQAVRGLTAADVDEPGALARILADRPDPVLRGEALRLAREALHAALLSPGPARALVADLADDPDVAEEALRELAEPWAALDPLPGERLRRHLGTGSLEVVARHGHRDLLWEVAADRDRPPASRRRALDLLGDLADRDDVPDLLGLALEDPLLFAEPAFGCLRGLHRRGHFPVGDDVPAIVGLALADHRVPAEEPATVLYTCRHEALRELAAAPPDDPHWSRRLDLLVALAAQGVRDLAVGDTVAGLLRTARDPVPFLRALRVLRPTSASAEAAVLEALPRTPAAALDALEAVGGARTATVLAELLGGREIVAHLRPLRHRALEVLWHLTEDGDLRRALLDRLDPRDLPARIAVDLGGPDERELALLRAALAPDDPVEALCTSARNGGSAQIPVLADLLLRIVSDLAAAGGPPEGSGQEPVVPPEAVEALRGLGRRLYERGKIRPRCLLDATTAKEAGAALVADIAADLLERPELGHAERTILLALLLEVPAPGIRARVHPLLRHRDRHVRKHAIALLARDDDGADARALSAGLIPLTRAGDVQTVRQAVLALGRARARWAAEAIAACLDHSNMNVKKTAADALTCAGAPVAVPRLLFWLGAHDNPGLRDRLTKALRTILGDASAATVLAAADRADDDRTRTLLLMALDRRLEARAVGALVRQGSPSGARLLALVADGTIALRSGTASELAALGISPPPGRPADVDALVARGWDPDVALRLARGNEEVPSGLRPMLAHWLGLAEAHPETLGFVLRLCPPPWSADEVKLFARSVRPLVAGLADIDDDHRDRLVAVLNEAVAGLPASEAFEIASRLRALPPGAAGSRAWLALLRRSGAVLTRADVERALAAVRVGARPSAEDVLREAFAAPEMDEPLPEEAFRWREALSEAVRSPAALGRFRAEDGFAAVGSRHRLNALIDVFSSTELRDALLDWMCELQPVDAPPWTLAEKARRRAPALRTPRPSDLDQPRSAAQRERLLSMLDDPAPDRREAAARTLLTWPEPETRLAVLRAHLQGRVDITVTADLARASTLLGEGELHAPERLAAHLASTDLGPLVPHLLRRWEQGDPATRERAGQVLRRASPDTVAEAISDRLEAGAWGLLDLVAGVPLLRTPALTRTMRRLRQEGRDDLAAGLVLVDGPLRHPDAARRDEAVLAALRDRTAVRRPQPPSRADLFHAARTGTADQIRRALTLLAERPPEGSGFGELLDEMLGHPEARVRLQAHRITRKVLDRDAHLERTTWLLDDPQPDIVRSAAKALAHASWRPAIPGLVRLLTHAHPGVRRTAAEGLVLVGAPAIPALRHAAGRARPDRRPVYTEVLDRINAPGPDAGRRSAR